MTYYERLNSLGALTLTKRRSYADMTTVALYIFLHHHINCTASDAGIVPVSSVTRSDGLRLVQLRPTNLSCTNRFSIRSASMWNKLPSYIVNSNSLAIFKRKSFSYFHRQQSLNAHYFLTDHLYIFYVAVYLFIFLMFLHRGIDILHGFYLPIHLIKGFYYYYT